MKRLQSRSFGGATALLPRWIACLCLALTLFGCAHSEPDRTVNVTEYGLSETDLTTLNTSLQSIRSSIHDSAVDRTQIAAMIEFLKAIEAKNFELTVADSDLAMFGLLLTNLDAQVQAIEKLALEVKGNQVAVRELGPVLVNALGNLQNIKAISCTDQCQPKGYSEFIFNTFFGGGTFTLALIGGLIALTALFSWMARQLFMQELNAAKSDLERNAGHIAYIESHISNSRVLNNQAFLRYTEYTELRKISADRGPSVIDAKQNRVQLKVAIGDSDFAHKTLLKARETIDKLSEGHILKQDYRETCDQLEAHVLCNMVFYKSLWLRHYGSEPGEEDTGKESAAYRDEIKKYCGLIRPQLDRMQAQLHKDWHRLAESNLRARFIAGRGRSRSESELEGMREEFKAILAYPHADEEWVQNIKGQWDELTAESAGATGSELATVQPEQPEGEGGE